MAIPSEVLVFQGNVQRLDGRHLKEVSSYDEEKVQRTNILFGDGSENYSAMNLEVAGSSPAEITTTNHRKSVPIIFNFENHEFQCCVNNKQGDASLHDVTGPSAKNTMFNLTHLFVQAAAQALTLGSKAHSLSSFKGDQGTDKSIALQKLHSPE